MSVKSFVILDFVTLVPVALGFSSQCFLEILELLFANLSFFSNH